MKKSKNPTNTRLLKGYCGDDFQICPAAILTITPEVVEKWKLWDKIASETKEKYTEFVSSEYIGVDIQFLGGLSENLDETLEKEGDIWVTLTGKKNELFLIDEKIWGTAVNVSGGGYISFSGQGKHSGIEFWTESININDLTIPV